MSAQPTPDPVHAYAPEFAGRLVLALAPLAAIIAHAFLRHPKFAPLIVFLWTRIIRAGQRVARLAARIEAGRTARVRAPRPGPRPRLAGAPPRQYLPRQRGWLLHHLGAHRHHAGLSRFRLECLLAEPGAAEFLAATPGVAAILRPILRLLDVRDLDLPRRPRKPKPARPRASRPTPPRRAARPPLPHLVAPSRPRPSPSRPRPILAKKPA
jgi:hypothetical protein